MDLAEGPPARVGDEIDLTTPGPIAEGAAGQAPTVRSAEPVRARGTRRRYAIAGLVGVVILGGGLAFVPSIGPFGASFLGDEWWAKEHQHRLNELRASTSQLLGEDTGRAVASALEQCKAVQQTMRRFAPVKALCAYIALERGLRFGRRAEDEAYAKLALDDAGEAGGDLRVLALAAMALLNNQGAQAAQALQPLRARLDRAGDESVAVLAARIATATTTPDQAKAAWSTAVGVRKNARTLLGLASTLYASGDTIAAESSARAALLASPNHAGARILLARLTVQKLFPEAEAIALLNDVTAPGPVRNATDTAELVDALTLLGQIHLARSRITAAEQAFAAALKLDPLAVQALVGNGELLYRSGRFSEAQARYEGATHADPDNLQGQVGIAKTWIALERPKEARDLLRRLQQQHPAVPLVLLWKGRSDEALGNRKDAEAAYLQAIQVGKTPTESVDAYVALAHLLSGTGRTDEANARLSEASSKFPDSPVLHRAKGDVALQMGRYEEARKELEASLVHDEDISTRFRLGITLRHMKRYDEASRAFDIVATADKDFPGLALERGILFEETGHTDKALDAYQKALEKAPNDVDLKLRVGSTQVIAGHGKEAEPILQEVRNVRPSSAEVNHFLGRAILLGGGSAAEAMRFLELAVNLDGNRAEYFLYLGWAANALGGSNSGKARAALDRAIELDHELGDAYWQRGLLLQREGASVDALHDLDTALRKRPSRFEAWAAIASCDQDLQKWAEAEQAWRKAIAGNDQVAEWHYRLGKLLANRGSQTAALPELEKATALSDLPGQNPPVWLFDAHLLLAEACRARNDRAAAIRHYRRFLETAPGGNAYIPDAEKALEALGAPGKP
jgi:tetratricopeptide (TPR) repeat protein